jgi:hypothetical protein
MKTALFVLFSFAAVSPAQDAKQPSDQKEKKEGATKKLSSVTWNLETHKLIWTVQKGATVNGEFVPASEDRYEISPDDAVMAFSNEKRGFTEEEATSLHHLLDVLSLYCAESVVWWDQGQGTPLDPSTRAIPGKQEDKPKKPATKVDERQKNAPKYHVSDADLVAALQTIR